MCNMFNTFNVGKFDVGDEVIYRDSFGTELRTVVVGRRTVRIGEENGMPQWSISYALNDRKGMVPECNLYPIQESGTDTVHICITADLTAEEQAEFEACVTEMLAGKKHTISFDVL